jgi:thiosulfate/3-mercaptopyruvate sulfurtransferase
VTPGDFTARPGHMPVVDAVGAAALARDGVLIDVRAAERYRGETEPIDPVAGHIPGALNVPIADTGNEDGTFKPPAALGTLFATLTAGSPANGATPAGDAPPSDGATATDGPPAVGAPADGTPAVGAYCGSGVTAARGVLALALAGIPAALYPGSWSDWIADPTRPIARQFPHSGHTDCCLWSDQCGEPGRRSSKLHIPVIFSTTCLICVSIMAPMVNFGLL